MPYAILSVNFVENEKRLPNPTVGKEVSKRPVRAEEKQAPQTIGGVLGEK